MNLLKRLTAAITGLLLMFSSIAPAFAFEYADIQPSFKSYKEIMEVTDKQIMTEYKAGSNLFMPSETVTRAEFTQMLVKTLQQNNIPITIENRYPDVVATTKGHDDIIRADQLKIAVGFTDGMFKPTKVISKTEAESMLADITKQIEISQTVLLQFADSKEIPEWGVSNYAKAIQYGLYYNDPEATKLTPNNQLHRYEAAVLLAKLSNNLQIVKDELLPAKVVEKPEPPKEYVLSTEHFDIYPKATVNTVTLTNLKKSVLAGNVFKVSYAEAFSSKQHQIGDTATFYFKKDVATKEGTVIFPENTKLYATISELKEPQLINKNGQVYLNFERIELPNGQVIPFKGNVLNNKNGVLEENYWKKPLATTAAGIVIGTGVGLGVGCPTEKAGTGVAIGLPVGAGLGLATGIVTKGLYYNAKANEDLFIELKTDCNIYNEKI